MCLRSRASVRSWAGFGSTGGRDAGAGGGADELRAQKLARLERAALVAEVVTPAELLRRLEAKTCGRQFRAHSIQMSKSVVLNTL